MSKRASRRPAARGAARGLPGLILLIALTLLAASAMAGVPAELWAQPGFAELRGGLLQAQALARTPSPAPPQPAVIPSLAPGTQPPGAPEPVQTAGPPTAAASQGWYHVYFTDPHYPDQASDHKGGVDAHLVDLIASAKRQVDVAAYELDLDTVADALLAAKARGVTVRLVTDTDYLEEKALQRLEQGGIPVVDDKRGAIMHDKFVVVDGAYVWTGSWNLTVNCTYRNNNNAILIASKDLAGNYAAEFAEMFERREFGPSSPVNTAKPQIYVEGSLIENYFAPEDHAMEHVIAAVQQAKKSIRFMAFSFTDQDLGQALIARAKAGVEVSGVVEKRGSDTEYCQMAPLRQAGLEVLTDGNPYVMHHKVLIIDEEVVVTGSFNYSGSADRDNDENVLIIHNADIARLYLEEYQRVRQRALDAGQP